MKKLLLAALAALGILSAPAHAAQDQVLAFVVTTCGTLATPYIAGKYGILTMDVNGKLCDSSSGGGGGGTSATFGATFPATGTPVGGTDGTNFQPLVVDTTTHYLQVDVKAGGAGGGAVFGPTAVGSAAANPPVQVGGTVDGTATGNIQAWKVVSGVGYLNLAQVGGSAFALGQQLAAASLPIVLTAAQLTTLTPPAAITGFATAANQATEISSLATIATNSGLASNLAAAATGGCTAQTIFSAASNNATVIGSAAAHTLCFVRWENTGTNLYSIRFYDTATAPSAGAPCNSATNLTSADVAQSNATSPGGVANNGPFGQSFASGIVVCITGANANNDNTNATTGLNLIIGFK